LVDTLYTEENYIIISNKDIRAMSDAEQQKWFE
jgi:hypothetical protein